jgi:hypothetical protein
VVGDLVADGAGDLGAQQVPVVSEVSLQGVLVDDDPVGVVVARDGVAVVVPVGAVLSALARHDHGDLLEDLLELVGELVERFCHQVVEVARGGLRGG